MPLYSRIRNQSGPISPWQTWVLVLLLISLVEWGLMLLLPRLLPAGVPRLVEAWCDSALLLIVLAPVLWWLLMRPLQRSHGERELFLRDLFATIEQERRATARDLHDGVGQGLTLLVTRLRSLKADMPASELDRRLTELRELSQATLAETRRLAQGLRPSLLDDLGLVPAIERVLAEVQGPNMPHVSSDLRALAGVRLPEQVETTLFRQFQEALQNAIRHAHASQVEVRLLRQPASVILEVVDNGRGFEMAAVSEYPTGEAPHMGLAGMSERAALAGGRLTLESAPGKGTSVEVELPVERRDA